MTQKEKVFRFLTEVAQVPLLFEELAILLSVPEEAREELKTILEELLAEGSVVQTKKKRYAAADKMGLIKGRYIGNERGFGFVEQEGEDLYIPADKTGNAIHGDFVLAKPFGKPKHGERQEGEMVRVLRRSETPIVGTFEKNDIGGFVSPDDKRLPFDIFIPQEEVACAKNDDKVVVQITQYERKNRNPIGKITEVLGNRSKAGVDILSVIRKHGIADAFSEKVRKAAACASALPQEEEIKNRADFRKHLIFTIDGEDAKDLDDAVEISKYENGNYRLGVHIADVGYYVPYGSILDKEAYRRGTSVYLPDRVLPMLPTELSNGCCSLLPQQDRLTLSVIMEIDISGNVLRHEIKKSVICSAARMNYHEVTAILNGDSALQQKYAALTESLRLMKELKDILYRKRAKRGSINFDLPETKLILDACGKTIDVQKYEITESNHIIEEFMLVCNETVAEDFAFRDMPFVYRVHEKPSEEKFREFAAFSASLGYPVMHGKEKLHPKEFQKLLAKAKDTPEEKIIGTILLRSMAKARYSAENLGHFGLAAKYYCHFTSPIRRYPDLVIHRIIADVLCGTIPDEEKLSRFTLQAAERASDCETAATEAEREAVEMKKAEYMQAHLGEVFEGVVSAVTSFGIFAELENTVEGLIRMTDLTDDYYWYDEKNHCLIGEHTNRIYRIGDSVTVQAVRADTATGQIDFVLSGKNGESNLPPHRKNKFAKKTMRTSSKQRKHKPQKRYLKKKQKSKKKRK